MLAKIFIAIHATNPVDNFQSSHYWSFSFSWYGHPLLPNLMPWLPESCYPFGLHHRFSVFFPNQHGCSRFLSSFTAASIDALCSPTRSYQVPVVTISYMLKSPMSKQLRTFSLDCPPKFLIVQPTIHWVYTLSSKFCKLNSSPHP